MTDAIIISEAELQRLCALQSAGNYTTFYLEQLKMGSKPSVHPKRGRWG